MSRYVNDIQTSKTVTDIEAVIEQFMKKEGFTKTMYKAEEVWKKGIGLMMGPQYIKVEPGSGSVHIEAWIKFAILPGVYAGEMGTSGLLAVIPKGILKGRVKKLETQLNT